MRGPRLSVIIPAFEAAPFLGEALQSVLAQGYEPLEVIVVDDGSTDGGDVIASGFGGVVSLVRQQHRGAGAARNHGLRTSRGELVAFLDADNRYAEGALDRLVGVLHADPEVDIVFGAMQEFVSDVQPVPLGMSTRPPATTGPVRLPGTFVARRAAVDRIGPFAEHLRRGEVVDWMARADELDLCGRFIEDIVLLRRLHGASNGLRQLGHEDEYLRVVKAALDRRRGVEAG